jgi:hypothetical protein
MGFLAMTIACFAFASYFAKAKQTRWAVLSAAVGLAVIAVCAFLAASSTAERDSFKYVPRGSRAPHSGYTPQRSH